jgi:hypothetical protein
VRRRRGRRDAESVRHVAPAIAAAGLVLSSSFVSLILASDQGTREMGFAMALGILIAPRRPPRCRHRWQLQLFLLGATPTIPCLGTRRLEPGRRASVAK